VPKIRKKGGVVEEFSYTPEGMAAAEKAKAAGGQMLPSKGKKKRGRKK
jgi:hypothetical protein